MVTIMRACIILHNMIVEDERGAYKFMTVQDALNDFDGNANYDDEIRRAKFKRMQLIECHTFERFHSRFKSLRDTTTYYRLRTDLVDHVWEFFGRRDEGAIALQDEKEGDIGEIE